jgi:hypothetical protein
MPWFALFLLFNPQALGSPSKLAKVLFAFPESMLPECHELEENKTGKVFIARANRRQGAVCWRA